MKIVESIAITRNFKRTKRVQKQINIKGFKKLRLTNVY